MGSFHDIEIRPESYVRFDYAFNGSLTLAWKVVFCIPLLYLICAAC